jgi:hypothetical protein
LVSFNECKGTSFFYTCKRNTVFFFKKI